MNNFLFKILKNKKDNMKRVNDFNTFLAEGRLNEEPKSYQSPLKRISFNDIGLEREHEWEVSPEDKKRDNSKLLNTIGEIDKILHTGPNMRPSAPRYKKYKKAYDEWYEYTDDLFDDMPIYGPIYWVDLKDAQIQHAINFGNYLIKRYKLKK